MQKNSSSSGNSPAKNAAKQHLDNLKYEIANEVGVNLKEGYNGDITSKDAGYIGGNMVKRMIEDQERKLSGK
ncbi:MAG: alpha/beta-type small acid-soluble spore protein [Clostridiales bacterium]|nr:alpha/beta-type small acid-soluble spore protein [Clostridiales bacterium]MBQ2816649.1 alpha/beta-type small acid-soluble spore protein [Clostridia bacterium]MBQ4638514.1 alpha/beta-type small acid-soluble spore protein [Clostridia bacterium]